MTALSDEELRAIAHDTVASYQQRAEGFRDGTWGHDVSQNVAALLAAIPGEGPHRVLDFGCGPGRDLVAFRAAGHEPTGLDGTAAFVEMARAASGATVLHQDFLALALPDETFDGVFANASLFHVPAQELPRVLRELHACLRPGGVLFSSNPRGENHEGWNGTRYGSYHDFPRWKAFAEDAGFQEIRHYYRPPGRPRDEQPWLASLWRRPHRQASPEPRPA